MDTTTVTATPITATQINLSHPNTMMGPPSLPIPTTIVVTNKSIAQGKCVCPEEPIGKADSFYCQCSDNKILMSLITQDSPVVKFCEVYDGTILQIHFANGKKISLAGTITDPVDGTDPYNPSIQINVDSTIDDWSDWIGCKITGYEWKGRKINYDAEFFCQVRLITTKGDLIVDFIDVDVDVNADPTLLSNVDVYTTAHVFK